jgi:hypothetical protein
VAEATWDAKASHGPEERVQSARLRAKEVPCRVMGSGCLGDLIVRARLDRVDEVWEPDGILNEEDRNVVSDDI